MGAARTRCGAPRSTLFLADGATAERAGEACAREADHAVRGGRSADGDRALEDDRRPELLQRHLAGERDAASVAERLERDRAAGRGQLPAVERRRPSPIRPEAGGHQPERLRVLQRLLGDRERRTRGQWVARMRLAGRRKRRDRRDQRLRQRARRRNGLVEHPRAHRIHGTAGGVGGDGAVPDAGHDEEVPLREPGRRPTVAPTVGVRMSKPPLTASIGTSGSGPGPNGASPVGPGQRRQKSAFPNPRRPRAERPERPGGQRGDRGLQRARAAAPVACRAAHGNGPSRQTVAAYRPALRSIDDSALPMSCRTARRSKRLRVAVPRRVHHRGQLGRLARAQVGVERRSRAGPAPSTDFVMRAAVRGEHLALQRLHAELVRDRDDVRGESQSPLQPARAIRRKRAGHRPEHARFVGVGQLRGKHRVEQQPRRRDPDVRARTPSPASCRTRRRTARPCRRRATAEPLRDPRRASPCCRSSRPRRASSPQASARRAVRLLGRRDLQRGAVDEPGLARAAVVVRNECCSPGRGTGRANRTTDCRARRRGRSPGPGRRRSGRSCRGRRRPPAAARRGARSCRERRRCGRAGRPPGCR